MNAAQIIFVICYTALLISYFFAETSGNFTRRAVNKIVMASAFFGYFIVETVRHDYDISGVHTILIAAFFFAWLGDVLLLWSFTKGGVSFMASNILFFAYLVLLALRSGLRFGDVWWSLLILVALVGTVAALYFTKKIDFGKVGSLMLLYLLTVTMHGSLSIAMMSKLRLTRMLLLGGGLTLFMISDYFLITNKFIHKRNWVLRCNSGTYFIGMLLAAVSMSY